MSRMQYGNPKSFTMLETILAAILIAILMVAGTASIAMMYQAVRNFHSLVQDELNWYDFVSQISNDVHRASYAVIDGTGNNLTLYGYGAIDPTNVIATYSNVTAGQARGVQYNGQAIQRFQDVNATFQTARIENNSIREIRINIASPFVNTLYLKCAISLMPSSIAILGGADGTGYQPINIIQTRDGGFLILASNASYNGWIAQSSAIVLIKLTNKLTLDWVKKCIYDSNAPMWLGGYYSYNVEEVSNSAGQVTGYVFPTTHGGQLASSFWSNLFMTDSLGITTYNGSTKATAVAKDFPYAYYFSPIRTSETNPAANGLIFLGEYQNSSMSPFPLLAAKTNNGGSITQSWLYQINVPWPSTGGATASDWGRKPTAGDQIFDASGNPAGFAIAGDAYRWVQGIGTVYCMTFLRVFDNGAVDQARAIMTTHPWNADSVKQVYDSSGVPNGYIMGAHQIWEQGVTLGSAVYRLDQNCNYKWSYLLPATTFAYNQLFQVCPTTDGCFVASCNNGLIKLNDTGGLVWQKQYDYPGKVTEPIIVAQAPIHDPSGTPTGYIGVARSTYTDAQITCPFGMCVIKADLNGNVNANSVNIIGIPATTAPTVAPQYIANYTSALTQANAAAINKNPGDP